MRRIVLLTLFVGLQLASMAQTDSASVAANSALIAQLKEKMKSSFGSQIFLGYRTLDNNGVRVNEFAVKRGYLDVKTELSSMFSARITTDITQDAEGDGLGDLEMRLKYAYLKSKISDWGFLKKQTIEFGLVHRPYIDFEQAINTYRVQGKMFLEAYDVTTSADFGLEYETLLGEPLDKEAQKRSSSNSPGRFGSFAIGIFNGGGYHTFEYNHNKLVEGRLTIRPLPDALTGLQLTYHFSFGKGNIPTAPKCQSSNFMLSYESPFLNLTGEYYKGVGDYQGKFMVDGAPTDNEGYSAFAEIKWRGGKFTNFGRYESFQRNSTTITFDGSHYLFGVGYYLTDKTKIVLDYDYNKTVKNTVIATTSFTEIAVELKF